MQERDFQSLLEEIKNVVTRPSCAWCGRYTTENGEITKLDCSEGLCKIADTNKASFVYWKFIEPLEDKIKKDDDALRKYFIDGMKTTNKIQELQDALEFEARVAQKLLTLDCEDVPCGHGMTIFCPNPPFKNKDCGAWCLLREARLQVEKEMEENQ